MVGAEDPSRAAPPARLWISLGYSTLDPRAVDFSWLQSQCEGGRVLQSLRAVKAPAKTLIVPVFDDGRCFYVSQIAPFAGRNPHAAQHERALREVLAAAQRAKTPVYLGLDVLAWQKTLAAPQKGIFAHHPEWQEVNVAASQNDPSAAQQGARPEALFASPFHPRVRQSLAGLVRELGQKFPSAAGIALNVRLSDRDILGYSTAARRASLLSLALDPVDFNLSNRAELTMSEPLRGWMQWRKNEMASLVSTLATTYRAQNKNGKIVLSGVAGYEAQRDFNDLRRSQDWKRSLKGVPLEAILLEGRYVPRFDDAALFLSARAASSAHLVPQSLGRHLVGDSNYALEWAALKSRAPQLNELALYARSDADLQQIASLASQGAPLDSAAPSIGAPAPDWTGVEANGTTWNLSALRGEKESVALVLNGADAGQNNELETALSTLAAQSRFADTEFSWSPQLFPRLKNGSPARVHRVRANRELLRAAQAGATLVAVDRAGFLRRLEEVKSAADLERALSRAEITPPLQIGQTAPAFSLPDMNGRLVTPTMLAGRKNLLLTWFPKCFTGGCAQQLASLRDHHAAFAAADTEIIAVSVDPPDAQKIFAENLGLPFVLLPDTRRHLSMLYGAVATPSELAARQSVLIDKNGIVRLIDREVDTHSHGPDLLRQMKELGFIGSP